MANITNLTVGGTTYNLQQANQTLTNLHDNNTSTYQSDCTASGLHASACGSGSTATGDYSHAEGRSTTAAALYSHAEGFSSSTPITGTGTHAEGYNTTANAYYSHTEGYNTTANGNYSYSSGYYTTAACTAQTVVGSYNVIDTTTSTTHPSGTSSYGQYAFIVGNGDSDASRTNLLAIDWEGNMYVNNSSQPIGHIILVSRSSNISTTSGTTKAVLTVNTMTKGIWLVNYGVRFAFHATGYRRISFHTEQAWSGVELQLPASGKAWMQLQNTKVIEVTEDNQNWYLNATQNSGSSLAVEGADDTSTQSATYVYAVKIAEV